MTNRMLTVTNCTTVSGARMSWRLLRETTASSIQALRSPNTTWPITRTGGHTKKRNAIRKWENARYRMWRRKNLALFPKEGLRRPWNRRFAASGQGLQAQRPAEGPSHVNHRGKSKTGKV